MASYTKLFASILQSTVWQMPDSALRVWVTMLVLKDRDGIVEAAVPGLAHTARVSLEDCEAALAAFLAPDPGSRDPAFEGRRIIEVAGGWLLLNAQDYRDRRSAKFVSEAREYGSRWPSIRRAALKRDDHRCVTCGRTDGLHVHHIRRLRSFVGDLEAAHSLSNLRTLCIECHLKAHGRQLRATG